MLKIGVEGLGNISSGKATPEQVLDAAIEWLGENPEELAPGVFRKRKPEADGTFRQFRMRDADLTDADYGPHVHFERVQPKPGRPPIKAETIENAHIQLIL